MKSILLFFFILAFSPLVFGQDFSGQYFGQYNGDNVHLTLESAGQNQWTGLMKDSGQEYNVTASNKGNNLKGIANCVALGVSFDLTGQLNGSVLDMKMNFMGLEMAVVFTKSGGNAPSASATKSSAMPTLPSGAQHDPKLIGTWMQQENYNSGAGMDGYFSSNSYLAFNSDGTLTDLGSETMVGSNSGSGRSSNGGSGVVPGVKWYTEKNGLFLVATDGVKTETARLGKYYIENGALLITADNGTKVLYYKK